MGTRQTEIDALAALRPADLGRIAREAIVPFFDSTLASRFEQARLDWEDEAQEIIDGGLDGDREQIMAVARDKLSQVRALIDEVNESLQTSAGLGDMLEFEPPEPVVPAGDAFCPAGVARPWSAAPGTSLSSAGSCGNPRPTAVARTRTGTRTKSHDHREGPWRPVTVRNLAPAAGRGLEAAQKAGATGRSPGDWGATTAWLPTTSRRAQAAR